MEDLILTPEGALVALRRAQLICTQRYRNHRQWVRRRDHARKMAQVAGCTTAQINQAIRQGREAAT